MYEYKFKVLERHLDTFGHVNNATYLQLYEEARWDFCTRQGVGLDWVKTEKKGPVILDLQLSFKRELLLREEVLITSHFVELKREKIVHFHQKMLKQDGKLASELYLHFGLMDLVERKLIKPAPQWLKSLGYKLGEI